MSAVKPMLAKDGDPSTLSYPLIAQPKLDGIRAMVVDGKLVSRTLKPIPNAEIRAALERPEYEGFDGELIVGTPEAADCYRTTSSFVMAPNKTGELWSFNVFDLWNHDGPSRTRLADLEDAVAAVGWQDVPVFTVASRVVTSPEDVEQYETDLLAIGHEGVILRDPDALYKFGRSGKKGPLIKVKRFIDFEARVIGVYEEMHNANEAKTNALGRTERSSAKAGKQGKGTLGGLVLIALNGPHEGQEFRCGTGFGAADRIALWTLAQFGLAPDGDGLNGRVAKIKAFPIGVKDAPRHPVFLGWRDMAVDG